MLLVWCICVHKSEGESVLIDLKAVVKIVLFPPGLYVLGHLTIALAFSFPFFKIRITKFYPSSVPLLEISVIIRKRVH